MTPFAQRLQRAVLARQTPLCVGIDPHWNQLPESWFRYAEDSWEDRAALVSQFCRDVIDAVAPLVPAVKPQAAFFEQLGPPGFRALAEVVHYARQKGLIVILDAKRGDVGTTAAAYAQAYLQGTESAIPADALTVNPYLGRDSLEPFVQVASQHGTGLFVLVKTSNPGSRDLQDTRADDQPLYMRVASLVHQLQPAASPPSDYGLVGAVVGATYPEQLAELRAALPQSWLLVPGLGAQGATAADVAGAFDPQGLGALVNSSRAIIFAFRRPEYSGRRNWQQAVEAAARDTIAELAQHTPAGNLARPPAGNR
jgi:orotidine-5'-phosphate decarboxylase